MKVENSKELEKLIQLLRKTGVESLKFGEFEIKLRPDAPPSKYKKKLADDGKEIADMTPEEKLAHEEQLLFWSSTPPGAMNG